MTQRKAIPGWMQEWWIYFAAVFLLTFAIFWPSFFSSIIGRDMPVVIHGVSATGWMLLTVLQAGLIRTKRRKLHRVVGYSSLVLAAIVVGSGVHMVRRMIARDGTDAIGEPLLTVKFFVSDISSMFLFSLFLVLAILAARRKDIGLHLRLMACTALLPLIPAFERLFLALTPTLTPDWTSALHASVLAMAGLTALATLAEWRFGRLRWPFAFMLAYYLSMVLAIEPLAGTDWFRDFVLAFGGR